jgi:hypothetical protein
VAAMKKRRTEITIETDRTLIVRKQPGSVQGWCQGCGGAAKMISPEEAAAIAHVSVRTIYRWVEVGKVHFMERSEQVLLVCLNSLLRNANAVITLTLNEEK